MAVKIYQNLSLEIVFEDQDLLVLNKPSGVVVNQAETVSSTTIQTWMKQHLGGQTGVEDAADDKKNWQELVPPEFEDQYGTPKEIFLKRQGIVHRLDKETSGVLLLAKNPGALVNLLHQFKQRQVRKKYICLVHGKLKINSGAVRAPIGRSTRNRHKYRVKIEGRSAATYYRLKQFYSQLDLTKLTEKQKKALKNKLNSYQQGFSLIECLPETGRTHQIRVHLTHIKHPIVADAAYGGQRRARLDRVWCPRQFLHAFQIQLHHPRLQKKSIFTAELSSDLNQSLSLLKQ